MSRRFLLSFLLFATLQVTPILAQEGEDEDPDESLKIAHAVFGSIAWVVFFPLGSILIRTLHGPNTVWIHASVQVFSTILVIVNVGLGIQLAIDKDELNEYHPIIGLVLFALLFFQAAGGSIHHLLFQRKGHRTIISHVHIWLGRALVTLGMINGGLGLLLADDADRSEYIAYGVVAGLGWVTWITVDVLATLKTPSKTQPQEKAGTHDIHS